MTEEKLKVVKSAMNEVSKMYGQESIMLLGDNMTMDVEKFSSGSLSLDYALGGGIPKGRIIEIYGPESSGKTTIALHMIAEIQKDGGAAAFIDAEHALDPEYAKNIGVKTEEVAICQPDCGEQALGIAEKLVNSGAFDLIVIDSVAALVPKAELEGEMGAANIGLQARLMSQALRKLTGPANKNKCTIVFINQLRDKVGVMYGNPETTSGGRALKFYASVRLDVRKTETVKTGQEAVANHVKVRVVKNKIAPPLKVAEFNIAFGEGIVKKTEIAELAKDMGIVVRSGPMYAYKDIKVKGMDAFKSLLDSDSELMEEIVSEIKNELYNPSNKTVLPYDELSINSNDDEDDE